MGTRQTLLELLRTRLQGIHIADGFNTDAGDHVFLGGAPRFGPDDPPTAIALIVGDDSKQRNGRAVFVRVPVDVQAQARADLDEPWVAIEQILADIERAVEVDDDMIRANDQRAIEIGPTRTFGREPGSQVVGVGITYTLTYKRAWGQP